jgi:branched-chain amino acid transport system substrate-binding protein
MNHAFQIALSNWRCYLPECQTSLKGFSIKRGDIVVKRWIIVLLLIFVAQADGLAAETVEIGLNFPKSGPYSKTGMDQWRATRMAVDEINTSGGILGRQVQVVWRDSQSKVSETRKNILELIEKEGVQMVFGGVSSAVAIESGDICQQKGVIFMAPVSASNDTTGKNGHRYLFRALYNAWMGGKALGKYLNKAFPESTFFYITADYTWGWSAEDSLRHFTSTDDKALHKQALVPFPGATESDIYKALFKAAAAKPKVLVLVLFGKDMEKAAKLATQMGLKQKMAVIVPILELSQAEEIGPQAMAGIIGTTDWNWRVPYQFGYERGKGFVEKFALLNGRYPGFAASATYTVLYEYKSAVERAGSFEAPQVIKALEGHPFQLLKDQQVWRALDHQCVQTVYLVKCKQASEVVKDKFKQDYFEIIDSFPGHELVLTEEEWKADRKAFGLPPALESLPGE